MKKQIKTEKDVYDETFNDIGYLYRSNARSLIKVNQELKLLTSYSGLD